MKTQHFRKRKGKIEYIVLHYPAMPGRSAAAVASYFEKTTRPVSTHYIVDSTTTIEFLSPNFVAYHCGGANASLNGACNDNSIGIDLCDNKLNKQSLSVKDDDWYFEANTLIRATATIANLLKEHNLPISALVRHNDVTNKLCPRPFCGADYNVVFQKTGERAWYDFKNAVENVYKELRS